MHPLTKEFIKSDITHEKNRFRQDEVKRATAYSKDKQKLFVLKNVLDNDPSHAVPLIVDHSKICGDDSSFETKADVNSQKCLMNQLDLNNFKLTYYYPIIFVGLKNKPEVINLVNYCIR